MKKLITLSLLVAVAGATSAASIQWNISLGRNGFIADSSGTAMNGSLYLILASDSSTLADAAESDTFETTLADVALASAQLTSGKNTATQTATTDALTVGTSYDFALVVYDTANGQYYVSSPLTETAYDEGATVVSPSKVTFNQNMVGSTYSGASWAPTSAASVPEPATGALALAGVALLFKRRRA